MISRTHCSRTAEGKKEPNKFVPERREEQVKSRRRATRKENREMGLPLERSSVVPFVKVYDRQQYIDKQTSASICSVDNGIDNRKYAYIK